MGVIFLHFLLMFIAFALLMPISAIIARYYKVTSKQDFPRELDNKFWWHSHLIMQIGATLLMSLGLYVMVTGEFATPHSKMGLLTATLVYLQVLSGLLRGSKGSKTEWGDHYNMSKRRKIFEFYHKNMGWVILGVSFITMTLGFAQIEQWIYLVTLILLWLIYGYVIVDSILNKRHIETWRAIWGEKND